MQQEKPVTEITDDKPQGPRGPSVIQFSGHVIKISRLLCLDRPTQDFNLCDHRKYVQYVKVSNLHSHFLQF